MGEILKKYTLLPGGLDVEINAPQTKGGDFNIHIQNEKGRLALSKSEFMQLTMMFYSASSKIKKYKKL